MKSFLVSLAATTAALVIGCQTPDVNNPVTVGDIAPGSMITKPAPIPSPTMIGFDKKITYTDPGVTSEVFRATGNVAFTITKASAADDNVYDVRITVNGGISRTPSDTPGPTPAPFTFGGSSKDRVRIPQGEKALLSKPFVVPGLSVPTILNMSITVSEQELEVGSMSLIKAVFASSDSR